MSVGSSSVGVDFDFTRWIAARRGSMEQQAREGAAYAYSGERKFRRTLTIARPVAIAIEATSRLWRDSARTELLANAVKVGDPQLARATAAARAAADALHMRVPAVFVTRAPEIKIKALGNDDAPHLILDHDLVAQLSEEELIAALGHELGHIQNGHLLYATALYYLTHGAAFFVRWIVQPAIMTLQAWSRRAEVTCDRAALLAVRNLDQALASIVKLELGLDKGSTFNVDDYLAALPDPKQGGLGRWGELFRSHPYVPKRVAALRLFADGALFASVTNQDPTGKASAADVDKQVAELISVF